MGNFGFGATIRSSLEIQCLLYAEFLVPCLADDFSQLLFTYPYFLIIKQHKKLLIALNNIKDFNHFLEKIMI